MTVEIAAGILLIGGKALFLLSDVLDPWGE
jgi:hypothetical protein